MEILQNLSVKDLNFKKTKEKMSEHKKNYIITSKKGERIKIIINKGIIPFGYESYNGTNVLNIEINPELGNDHYNIFSYIQSFESEFVEKNNIQCNQVNNDIEGKEYYLNMKKSKGGYIIRSYVFGNPEIFININKFKTLLTSNDIKKTIANIELALGTLWINDNNYGFLWYVRKIEVLHNY